MNIRFDTLRVKLFVAIAGANIVLVMAAYLIYGWSFEQGLGEYLNRTEEERLTPVVARLAEGYQEHGSWDWLVADRRLWSALLREELGAGRGPRGGDDRARTDSDDRARSDGDDRARTADDRPRSGGDELTARDERARSDDDRQLPPLTIDPRLMLFDAHGQVLHGDEDRADEAVRKPISVAGEVVGYLAYLPRLQMVASLERLFSAQLNSRFGAIAIGMLAAVLVNAALIASWLSRRLRALSAGATALTQGEYSTRMRVHGDDELARLAGDFNRLAAALEAAQRTRQQWIADIAHELRTPLATLKAEIEALEDGVRPLSTAGMSSLAQEVVQLTRLVDDLRLLSLSDLGALSYQRENIELAEAIDDSLLAQRVAIDAKPLAVEVVLDRSIVVFADGARLAQVFGNLLQNTLRYTDAPGRLRITLQTSNGDAVVCWEDSPPGVAPADLARLTERLFRVDDSRARSSGGSGLGLAIVKAIVEAHGGGLVASASELGGLRWTLRLPRVPK